MAVTLSESYGGRSSRTKFIPVGDSVWRAKRSKGRRDIKESIEKIFKDAFLPQGYPDSVSKDYLKYQTWDTLQAFCSYITGTLATQAVLKGVGVGDSSASPIAATITWLLKDGLGMIGRILFAWLKGTDLDCNAKRWRLIADILNDLAMFLDLLAPVFPAFFMLIICLSSLTRSIVGVAGGATRAALVQHQARRDNMADVSAKDGSQETIVNLAGLIIGLVLTPLLAGKAGLIWLLFVMFTCLHLYANYQAVSVVCMETFNRKRLHLFMKQFLKSEGRNICTPKVINLMEPVITERENNLSTKDKMADPNVSFIRRFYCNDDKVCSTFYYLHHHDYTECPKVFQMKLGAPLSDILLQRPVNDEALKQMEYQHYIIHVSSTDNTVYIAFSANSTCLDHFRAVITTEVIEYIMYGRDKSDDQLLSSYYDRINRVMSQGKDVNNGVVSIASEVVADLFNNDFIGKVQNSGWVTTHHLLGLKEWRYTIGL